MGPEFSERPANQIGAAICLARKQTQDISAYRSARVYDGVRTMNPVAYTRYTAALGARGARLSALAAGVLCGIGLPARVRVLHGVCGAGS
jgi:hypothetical protein